MIWRIGCLAAAVSLVGCSTPTSTPTEDTSSGGDTSQGTATGASSGGVDASSGDMESSGSTSGDVTTGGHGETSSGSTGEPEPEGCGDAEYDFATLIAGPGEVGFDSRMEAIARRHDRVHLGLATEPHGMACDLRVSTDDAEGRAAIDAFLGSDSWDFAEHSGMQARDVVEGWSKATGAYAGVAAAADAYRYGTLRDQGYPCEDVEVARAQVERALEGLHLATALTGEPGLVVRAYAHVDWPGDSASETTPIFDLNGNPNPLEKTNGTWREDNSGEHPEFKWEDSCSRDQLIGWATGYAAVWEVIREDPSIDDALKSRLQLDALAIANQLRTVRPSGYDLEIWDPEGRPTFHGYLHEHNIEGVYVQFLDNGMYALMGAGIVAAFAYVAEDPQVDAYLYTELLGERDLVGIGADSLILDFGVSSNYSGYNMGFGALWLISRYVDDDDARDRLRDATAYMYDRPGASRQPEETAQTFFDFVYAAAFMDASAFAPTRLPVNEGVVAQGWQTLTEFPTPPAWDFPTHNCDADEVAAGTCTLDNGQVVELLGEVGHNDELVADVPVPMATRPHSNYHWRSNPYRVNTDGSGEGLFSSADFRFAYWMGRWIRR